MRLHPSGRCDDARRKRSVVLRLVFPLHQEQKSDLRLFSRQQLCPRAAICLRFYIGNVVHVDVYLLIFDISQPFPCCHVEPPKGLVVISASDTLRRGKNVR
jgi:hypothetical protein